jgi:L-asparaginase/Glu-tRNA(Gln) amidotransferase subunit D
MTDGLKRNATIAYRQPTEARARLTDDELASIETKKRSFSMPENLIKDGHAYQFQSFASDAVNFQKHVEVDEMVSTSLSKVLIIYTGGTIGMKNTEYGYVPVRH